MGKILFAEHEGVYILKFVGDVRLNLGPTISSFQDRLKHASAFHGMVIDLTETVAIDSTALGLIAKIAITTREAFDSTTSIVSPSSDVTRILKSMAMEDICLITSEALVDDSGELRELPHEVASEAALRDQVIDAHRTLMSFNHENEEKFFDLVEALENEKSGVPIRQAS
jgi:anti-anti-sigma regulatory factor